MRRMKGTPIIIDENAVKAPAKRRWVPPAWWRPVRNGTAGLVAATVLIGIPTWLVKSGTGAEFVAMTSHQALEGSAGAGMRLTRIELDGNVHLSSDDLLTALEAKEGDPILALDLAAARQRVQALPWVKQASVERQLPNAVVVRIT
ncbi:MAG: FtsQ-type POTRA domain-containing protein, partial [Rhodospirillales bacterium]|nr:FtsQ-type POTRA domain-containing protein [Rhodospirillales bacterium]